MIKAKHGHTRGGKNSKEYVAWRGMIKRCTYPTEDSWKWYGGRGIKVCDLWRKSFEAFLKEVGPAPSPHHSIDRIDTNGDYEPGNVRWSTFKDQIYNSKTARKITFNGQTKMMVDWARAIGITKQGLQKRLDIYKWSLEKCLTIRPPKRNYR